MLNMGDPAYVCCVVLATCGHLAHLKLMHFHNLGSLQPSARFQVCLVCHRCASANNLEFMGSPLPILMRSDDMRVPAHSSTPLLHSMQGQTAQSHWCSTMCMLCHVLQQQIMSESKMYVYLCWYNNFAASMSLQSHFCALTCCCSYREASRLRTDRQSESQEPHVTTL